MLSRTRSMEATARRTPAAPVVAFCLEWSALWAALEALRATSMMVPVISSMAVAVSVMRSRWISTPWFTCWTWPVSSPMAAKIFSDTERALPAAAPMSAKSPLTSASSALDLARASSALRCWRTTSASLSRQVRLTDSRCSTMAARAWRRSAISRRNSPLSSAFSPLATARA